MGLKKLSISEQDVELLMELLSHKESVEIIAMKIKVSRTTLWRNMVLLGIKTRKSRCEKPKKKEQYFRWEHYKNNSVI